MIISTIIILSVILLLGGFMYYHLRKTINRTNQSRISFKESMDLVELPVITFYNNNRKLNFLLDTGANKSYITSSIISLLDHKLLEQSTSYMGIDGESNNAEVCEMEISYNDQSFKSEFIIADMSDTFDSLKQESGVQIHGILGSLFFQKYKYILDFEKLIAYLK